MEACEEKERFDSYFHTPVLSCEYSLKWRFENFSKIFSNFKVLESNLFQPEPNVEWKIRIDINSSNWYIFVYRYCKIGNPVNLEWKFSFLDERDKTLYGKSKQDIMHIDTAYASHGISGNDIEKIITSKSDNVILRMYLKIFKSETITLEDGSSDAQFSRDVQQSFSEELLKIYDNQVGTDITLKIQDETVGAHKAILSARSPVFAKMFQQQMAESQSQVVDIQDIKMSTLKVLLTFIYSGQRRDYDFETSLDVYYAADKYEVLKLKEVCSLILIKKLDSENAIKLLQLADRLSDVGLKNRALRFIRLFFTKCVTSENWIEFQNKKSELYEEVIKYIND